MSVAAIGWAWFFRSVEWVLSLLVWLWAQFPEANKADKIFSLFLIALIIVGILQCKKSLKKRDKQIKELERTLNAKPLQRSNTPCPQPKPAHELPGASAWDFSLYKIACLLRGVEPTWPLPTQAARDEFNSLCRYIADDKLGEGLSTDIGYHTSDFPPKITDYTKAKGTIRQILVNRRQVRHYLYSHNRPIPEFLEERFDYDVMPNEGDRYI